MKPTIPTIIFVLKVVGMVGCGRFFEALKSKYKLLYISIPQLTRTAAVQMSRRSLKECANILIDVVQY